MKVIIFKAADTNIAVSLSDVREVIRRDGASSGEEVECIRGKYIKVCDAGAFLVGHSTSDAIKKTILLERQGSMLGLSTSAVSRIFDVNTQTVQLKQHGHSSSFPNFCHGIFSLPDFAGPIYLLDMEQLFTQETVIEKDPSTASPVASEEVIPLSRAICFKLGSCEYAFSIEETVEIIRGRESRSVPDTKSVIEGVINLRGLVLPVIDLRKVAGIQVQDLNGGKDTSKIIVVKCEDQLIGYRVELMTEVTPFSRVGVESLSETFSGMGKSWIHQMLRVSEQRTIFFINSDWFVKHAA